jgi:hypothetical protein
LPVEVRVAVGVAGGVAVVVAGGVAVVVAGGMFAAILGLVAITPGLASLLWWGVAWGVSGLGTTEGLSTTRKVSGMLFILVGLTALVGVEQGAAAAWLALILALAGAFRLWSTLAAVVAGAVAYFWPQRLRSVSTLRLLLMAPPFSDEIVWTPVPFLGHLLVRAFTEDPQAGLEAIRTVAGSLRQGGAARRALTGVTIYTMQNYDDLMAIAGARYRITWLPNDLASLGRDVYEVVPRLFQVSQSVAVALDSESPRNRWLGLSGAADDLAILRQNLPLLGRRAIGRWTPVVEEWQRLLAPELERPLAQAGEIPNPYEAGNPLRANRAALFRGQQNLTDAVATALLERNRPTLALYGPRRVGKTSFLLQLPRLLGGNTISVFVNLQAPAATRSTGNFLYTLARSVVNDARLYQVSLPPVERETFQRGDPFIVFEDWLQDRALPILAERRLLLTLDEFEKLGQAIEAGRVEEAVLDQLRSLIQHQPQLSLLFAGVATLDELGPHWSSYFINVRALRATYLRPHEAEGLIRDPDPESGFNLAYADAVVNDIISLTRCHPYLVQLLCADLVREANARQTHHATLDLLEAALVRALQSGEPYFRNVWDEMTGTDPASVAAGQGLLRRLAASAGPLPIPLEGADVAIRRAVDRMTRLDVIEEEVAGGYQFQVPLIKRWVIERAPMSLEE